MPETTKNWKWRRAPIGQGGWRGTCDRKSYRVKKTKAPWGTRHLIRFCCPKGKFKNGKCRVGMKLVGIADPRRRR